MSDSFATPGTAVSPDFSVHVIFRGRILEWVAISFSGGSSQPRDQTHVSCLAGGFFTTEPPGKPRSISLLFSCSVLSDSLQPHGLEPVRLLCSWDSPGKNTGMDCRFLLQGIFPSQGSNPCLLLGRWILDHWATWEAQTIIERDNKENINLITQRYSKLTLCV